jgi:hypothetical protein
MVRISLNRALCSPEIDLKHITFPMLLIQISYDDTLTLPFRGEQRKGQRLFREGKGAHEVVLVSHTEGWLEDVAAWQCAVVADNRSRMTPWLTRGGRQSFGPVGPKVCLGRILLWRSNRLPKWNGLGKSDFFGWKKIVEKNLSCCSLNKKPNFWIKTEEIRIETSFEILSKIDILRFDWKIQNLKVKPEFKRYCKYKYIEN